MANKKKKIPQRFKHILWSYDLGRIDLKKDKELIITQFLNYGTWNDLKWLFRSYTENEIRHVAEHPRRGLWYRDVLHFWVAMFNSRIKEDVYEKSIFKLNPVSR